MSNTTQNTLNTTTALSPAPMGDNSNSIPLSEIMAEAIKLDEAAKAVPAMVCYCIMAGHERRQAMHDNVPTLRQIVDMKKGDKSKELDLLSSLLLGFANMDELKTAQREGTSIKPDDTGELIVAKETNLMTLDQFDAARSRIGRELRNAATLTELGITSFHYSHFERAFIITTPMWLAPGMVASGRLAMDIAHPIDGKPASAMVGSHAYTFNLKIDHLVYIASLRGVINERKDIPDSPLGRMLAEVNGLRYIGQRDATPDTTTTQSDDTTTTASDTTTTASDTTTTTTTTPPPVTTTQSDDTTTRGPEATPAAYTASHFKKLAADFISATHLFVTECGKIARPVDMVTDDIAPHWKDWTNSISTLCMMRDAILENTARIDAAHAATIEANTRAAREKAFEKAPITHTRAKSNKAIDKAKSAA